MTVQQYDDAAPELRKILRRGFESKDLDYKQGASWDGSDKKSRCELVKDILAMANTLGGYLVIGVSEAPKGFSFDGLPDEQAKSFDSTKINAFVQSYADPPINTTVRRIEDAGKVFVIIEVPRFSDTPHLCQKDYPDVLVERTLYVRTDNNESAAIKTSADFRLVIERAIRNRADTLLTSIRSILVGSNLGPAELTDGRQFASQIDEGRRQFGKLNPLPNEKYNYFIEFAIAPTKFSGERFKIEQLRSTAFNATIDYTGWPFLFIHSNRSDVLTAIQNGLQMFISDLDISDFQILDFWRFYQSGLFYKKTVPTGAWQQPDVACFTDIAYLCAEAVDCLTRLYERLLDPADLASLTITLCGTEGRRLVNAIGAMPFFANYTSQIPEITATKTAALAEWRAGVEDFAVALIGEVQARFNWLPPNSDLARQLVRKLFSRSF